MSRPASAPTEVSLGQVAQWAASARPGWARRRLLIGALVVTAAMVYLIASGLQSAAVYCLTIAELRAQGAAAAERRVRVAGTLDGSSVGFDPQAAVLRFRLRDQGEALLVVYRGVKPDMFRDGAQVIVEGKLLPGGLFEAKTLLLKCPSRYESGTPVYQGIPTQGPQAAAPRGQ